MGSPVFLHTANGSRWVFLLRNETLLFQGTLLKKALAFSLIWG